MSKPELCERYSCRNVATHMALSLSDGEVRLADGTTHIGSGGDWTKALAHLTDKGWKLD